MIEATLAGLRLDRSQEWLHFVQETVSLCGLVLACPDPAYTS